MQRSDPIAESYLPYGRHDIDDDDIAAVTRALKSGWLTTGPAVQAFEQALAARVDAAHAVSAANGTAALHLACAALGLGPNDRVVVPALTFLATANAVRYVGAEVIFADCDPETGLMRPEDLTLALDCAEGGVKTVLPVHLTGQCAGPERIWELARSNGLKILEDACHALGATYRDRAGREHSVGACGHADAAVFSFHPVKTIAMGEGGAVTTNDAALADRLRRLRNHGMARDAAEFQNKRLAKDDAGAPNPWYYEMAEIGFNYRASDLHCALGESQLRKLDRFVTRRRELAARYDQIFAALDREIVRPIGRVPGCRPAWHLYAVSIDFDRLEIDRAELMRRLAARGVGSQVHYLPLHLQPYYRARYGALRLPGAEAYYARTLSLPLYPAMADGDVDRAAVALAQAIGA